MFAYPPMDLAGESLQETRRPHSGGRALVIPVPGGSGWSSGFVVPCATVS